VVCLYLGHADDRRVRHYARTNDTQLALTIKHVDERSRLVKGLIDVPAARAGRPNLLFFLGRGPDGQPRYCGNPAWASCPHRLACLKCAMYVGGAAAELLDAREGVLRFQTQVPMTPVVQLAADGNATRLRERLAELRDVPIPDPPGPDFVFNADAVPARSPTPSTPPTDGDRRTVLAERLRDLRETLATASAQGRRNVLVRALERQAAVLDADLTALRPPGTECR
jgi:hypothetical protein